MGRGRRVILSVVSTGYVYLQDPVSIIWVYIKSAQVCIYDAWDPETTHTISEPSITTEDLC